MNKIIQKIQKQIIQLLPDELQDKAGIALTDSCSEVARLVASWIKRLNKSNHIQIIKGVDVCGTKKAHDILAVTSVDNKIYIIDPTIWQFFPKEKSILIFTLDDINIALNKITSMYGGQWAISEEFIQIDKNEEKKYLDIISHNLHKNVNSIDK
jgi:hypothetical protein